MSVLPMESPEEVLQELISGFLGARCRYQAVIHEVRTKLEILDEEFQMLHQRNPINHMESRLKSAQSIMAKLKRKELPLNIESAMENLYDIAGIRVICSYINDIYTIADLLTQQDDVTVLRRRDYIKNPKPNGYRSLHLVLQIPIFLAGGKLLVPIEVQIRTIAMDFWASLEHELRYKDEISVPAGLNLQLQDAAESIAVLDLKMQSIYNDMQALSREDE